MKDLTLTMLDTSGIQNYIFNSNRLQENIGASELVQRATTFWAFQALQDALGGKHNIVLKDHQWHYNDQSRIEDGTLLGEVLYAGGGNTLILFQNKENALEFTRRLTRHILEDAPNLTVIAQHLSFDWGKDDLREKREQLLQKLASHKQARLPSVPLLGLGVSAVCQSTGLPAVQNNRDLRLSNTEDLRLISRETRAKIKMVRAANARLKETLGTDNFPYDVDKLGRIEGDESYVAVVHADGNRMGEHLNASIRDAADPRACITALRNFSRKVNQAGVSALQHVVRLVEQAVNEKAIPSEEGYLPIRPLVFGGDDLTLLCNGQIGVSLAASYLEAFEKAFTTDTVKGLEDVHARAGIAIVKMHYPFARAYHLSEELAASAKQFIKKDNESDCSALDWHYATGGLSGELDVIRKHEYEVKTGKLTLRPVRVDQGNQGSSGRYWRDGLERVILKFKHDTYWSKRKNKVVGLREPLRKGEDQVRTYRTNFDIQLLPKLADPAAQETGWLAGRCIYFDAVELFDHYLSIEKQEAQA